MNLTMEEEEEDGDGDTKDGRAKMTMMNLGCAILFDEDVEIKGFS